ncbi:phage tail protein [Bacillus sp. BP-3]|uniref:phage tail protein n=1 Tax=Bacillus sp. BP-3 TaxID=3022773 RepID=UPI00232FD163|nr:phage tail protein [Bacillus sp. BP-3]MDC2864650.1 phage tail protein [Bacillus sp. BP-3]
MKRVERPKIEQLSTGEQFHLVDMKLFEVIEGKNEPSSIRFEVPDTDKNKRVYPYVEDRNLLIFEGQYYIILVNQQDELGFKDCDAIQIGAELSLQTQEKKVTGYFSIEEALSHTFQGSNFKYINHCSKKIQLQFDNFGGESRMKMIRKVLERFDIECIFDNMTVIFADRIGKTTDKLYKFGYNVNAIKKTTDDRNCSFSVWLLGHTPSEEEGGGPQFTYYYESPLKYKMPELIRYRQAENIEDDKIKDKETAKKRCEEAVNDIPVVSITVDHKEANFDDSNEPKVGDKAILQHHKYNMDFDVRVVKRTRYPYEQTPNNYEFSNKRDELVDRTEEQKKWTADILSVVRELDQRLLEESNNYTDRINAMTDKKAEEAKQESEAAKKLAELVKENQKNFQTTIIESNTEPTTNLEPGKTLWLDTSKGKPGILKKWNGITWDIIVPDVDGAIKASEEKTNKEIQQILSDMQDLADKEWLDSQLKDKADKSGVYTKEESDKKLEGFVSKQIYETDKNGNIKKFDDISTKFTQTDTAISQMATKQSVTDFGNNVSQVSKTANEAKQTAEGNTRTISDIKATVDEQKTTVGNLSKKTTEIEEKAGQITEKLTSVEQKQGQFEQKTAELTRTTDSIKQSVESISKTQTTQGEQIKQAQSTLETQAEAIKAKVSITEVGNYVSSIGMDNLIKNSLLRKDASHWTLGTSVTRDTVTTYNGCYSILSNQSNLAADSWRGATSENVPASEGENFVMSGWFMTDDKSKFDKGAIICINFYDATGKRIFFPGSNIALENNVWKQSFLTAKAPAGTAAVNAMFFVSRNGKLWASKMMLQRGTKPSEFTENAMDVVGRDELLGQIAEKVATADYNKKTEQIDRDISATKEGISLAAKKTEVYTRVESDGKYATGAYVKEMEARISVTEKDILSTVRVGNVVSSINQTAEAIKIEAKRINLIGAVTAESIAGKFLEGITIRAKDPNDGNNFSEMSNGKVFTQGFVTPSESNTWAKKIVTGLEKGLFYSRGYKEDGGLANSVEIGSWGMKFNNGNDGGSYNGRMFVLNDAGQNKNITAQTYDSGMGWRPTITLSNPEKSESSLLSTHGIIFRNFSNGTNYKNEWIAESGGSHLTMYKSMLCCDDGWDGDFQVKNASGSGPKGIAAAAFRNSSQRKLKTGIKDLQFSALDVVMQAEIKEYYYKSDMEELYKRRAERKEDDELLTINDINIHYGVIADDAPSQLTDKNRTGVDVYGMGSINMAALKEHVIEDKEYRTKTEDRLTKIEEILNKIEKVINSENNS